MIFILNFYRPKGNSGAINNIDLPSKSNINKWLYIRLNIHKNKKYLRKYNYYL